MSYPTRRGRLTALLTVAALTALSLSTLGTSTAAAGDAPGTLTVVATGLDNPRGLALGKHGTLYVGEAGHAGPVCLGAPGELGPTCIGLTSQISRISLRSGELSTVVGQLPSIGTAVAPTGVDGIAYRDGKVYGVMTGSPQGLPPEPCAGNPDVSACEAAVDAVVAKVGDLVRAKHGTVKTVAEVGSFDYDFIVANKATLDPANPDFQPGDANPYGITATRGGFYVVDAGSNTLDFVDKQGQVSVVQDADGKPVYFPNPPGDPAQRFPYDDVPTCVATYHHDVWVGSLSGRVWKFDGEHVSLVADRSDGLTAINGCAVDPEGDLWVSNIFGAAPDQLFAPNTGSVMEVYSDGSTRTVASGVNFPAGIAIGRDHDGEQGKVYVAVNSICPKDLSLVSAQDPPVCQATGAVVTVSR